MTKQVFTSELDGRTLEITLNHVAKQANGSAWIRYGDTIILAASTMGDAKAEGFLPLTVNYQENAYASGTIPGSFFKREGRPGEHEILLSRMIDRPLRPLFPEGYANETQVFTYVMSSAEEDPTDFPAVLAASLSLYISDIPFATPVVGVRVGRINDAFILNPTPAQLEESELNMFVVVSDDGITMVEGGADFLPESVIVEGLLFAQESAAPILKLQHDIQAQVGKPKVEVTPPPTFDDAYAWLEQNYADAVLAAAKVAEKHARYAQFKVVKKSAAEPFAAQFPDYDDGVFGELFGDLKKNVVRKMIQGGVRNDGRDWKTVRPIDIDLGPLPRAHGSSIFTRGETQAVVASTLGTTEDEVKQDRLHGMKYKKFYLHYNFPPFSVGETRRVGSPGRREIGHGLLAERALSYTIPEWDDFPYTIRIVSDITESNGSSSMASICGGCLSLMDAGVPIREPIAGVAMGLIEEGDDLIVLTDILGDEDHLGDMDFKVAGGAEGITALQMDIKIRRVDRSLLERAMEQAREARLHILGEMNKAIPAPRDEMSQYAPRFDKVLIHPEKIRDVIGPGGKMIRSIVEESGAKIDISEDGVVFIYAADLQSAELAKSRIQAISTIPEEGRYYEGLVKKVVDFGCFVEIIPGVEGLVHISELDEGRVEKTSDVVREGDVIIVRLIQVDKDRGRLKLSRKAALGVTADQIDELNGDA